MIMRQQHDCHQPPSSKRSSSSLSSFFCALSEPRHDPARRPTGKQCPLNCCNYQTRDSIDGCVSKNVEVRGNGKYGGGPLVGDDGGWRAAPRCYLSPSGWCAATPHLLSMARHHPSGENTLWPDITQPTTRRNRRLKLQKSNPTIHRNQGGSSADNDGTS